MRWMEKLFVRRQCLLARYIISPTLCVHLWIDWALCLLSRGRLFYICIGSGRVGEKGRIIWDLESAQFSHLKTVSSFEKGTWAWCLVSIVRWYWEASVRFNWACVIAAVEWMELAYICTPVPQLMLSALVLRPESGRRSCRPLIVT